MNHIIHLKTRRLGVTLIEMLVVVAIMMFMLTIAAPMFRPDQDNAVARDTARALNAYIQEARAKAIATGRPCGVAFIPFENYPSACVVAQQVECPPLYTGGTYKSTVTVKPKDNQKDLSKLELNLTFYEGADKDDFSANWKKEGNLIRFGGRGVWYEMTSATACKLLPEDGTRPDSDFRPWTNDGSWTTTYEIQAVPISQAENYLQSIGMAEPLKVVRGAAIDLYYSGVGNSGQISNNSIIPVIIMFTPTGEVGLCYRIEEGQNRSTPTEKIYILCGQWDRALTNFVPEDDLRNYQTLDSYWIVIDPATGISTIEQNVVYGNRKTVTDARSAL